MKVIAVFLFFVCVATVAHAHPITLKDKKVDIRNTQMMFNQDLQRSEPQNYLQANAQDPPCCDTALAMFELECSSSSVSPSGPLYIDCSSSMTIESVQCNYDDGAIVESCNFHIVVDYGRFSPGTHSLLITAVSDTGGTATSVQPFTVPEPLEIECNVETSPGVTNVNCVTSNDLFLPPTCSLMMSGAEQSVNFVCDLAGISLTSSVYTPGDYVLTITAVDVLEQTATEVIDITILAKLDCSQYSVSPSGPLNVDCSATMTIIVSVECNYDDGAIVESCNFPIVVDYGRFSPGTHSLLITATSDTGGTATSTLTFTVPEPLEIECNVVTSPGVTNVACVTSNDLFQPPTCSLKMSGAEQSVNLDCNLAGISLTSSDYTPGEYILTISAIDVLEQTATEVIDFTILAPLMFELDCSSSSVSPSGPLNIDCSGTMTIVSVQCNYDNGAIVESCDFPIVVDFGRFSPGTHSLLITAVSDDWGTATSAQRFTVPEPLEIECNVANSPGVTNVDCVTSNDLFQPPTCSLMMSGAERSVNFDCDLAGISLTSRDYTPGDYVLTITAVDVLEQTATEVIDITILAREMFDLDCSSSSVSPSGPLHINCVGSKTIESVQCNYDVGAIVESCDFPIVVDYGRFSPGRHRLLITAISDDRRTATSVQRFRVPKPLEIECAVTTLPGITHLDCATSNNLFQPPTCSLMMSGIEQSVNLDCDLAGISLTSSDYTPGDYILTITAVDVFEQTVTEVINITILE